MNVSDERNFNDAEDDSTTALEVEHILAARTLGEIYGGLFVVPVAAAAVCAWRRNMPRWLEQGPDDEEIQLFAEHMKPHEVPDEIERRPGEGFERVGRDLEQMVALMRGLIMDKERRAKATPFEDEGEDAAKQDREKRQ